MQWPCPAGPEEAGTERLYPDGRCATPDGRARFEPTPHAGPAESVGSSRPLTLTTGRVAEHWHTLSRTGKSPLLTSTAGEPFVELHPDDAKAAGVREGEEALVSSPRGEVVARARLDPTLPPGVAFSPFHWGALHAPPGAGQTNAVTLRAVDPFSKQPELKAVAVAVTAPAAGALLHPQPAAAAGGDRHGDDRARGSGGGAASQAGRELACDDARRGAGSRLQPDPTLQAAGGNRRCKRGRAAPSGLVRRPRRRPPWRLSGGGDRRGAAGGAGRQRWRPPVRHPLDRHRLAPVRSADPGSGPASRPALPHSSRRSGACRHGAARAVGRGRRWRAPGARGRRRSAGPRCRGHGGGGRRSSDAPATGSRRGARH